MNRATTNAEVICQGEGFPQKLCAIWRTYGQECLAPTNAVRHTPYALCPTPSLGSTMLPNRTDTRPALIGLLCLLCLLCKCSGEPELRVRVGEPAPELVLKDADGEAVRLSDFRGRVVVLRWWSHWCCSQARVDLADLQLDHLQYRDRGLAVIGANPRDSRGVVSLLRTELDITYPLLLDPVGREAYGWGVVGPTTFLLDREGVVREKILGERNHEWIVELALGLLDEEERRRGDAVTRRRGDAVTRRRGDAVTRRRGDGETR